MSTPQEAPASKPFYKRWWFITLAVVILIGVLLPDPDPAETQRIAASIDAERAAADSAAAKQKSAESLVTKANFNLVQPGMNRGNVAGILGPGEETSNSILGAHRYSTYVYKGPDYGRATITYIDNEVSTATQLGLK